MIGIGLAVAGKRQSAREFGRWLLAAPLRAGGRRAQPGETGRSKNTIRHCFRNRGFVHGFERRARACQQQPVTRCMRIGSRVGKPHADYQRVRVFYWLTKLRPKAVRALGQQAVQAVAPVQDLARIRTRLEFLELCRRSALRRGIKLLGEFSRSSPYVVSPLLSVVTETSLGNYSKRQKERFRCPSHRWSRRFRAVKNNAHPGDNRLDLPFYPIGGKTHAT